MDIGLEHQFLEQTPEAKNKQGSGGSQHTDGAPEKKPPEGGIPERVLPPPAGRPASTARRSISE
eukprot:9380237-Pyramimonas_sp.AAC.1